MEIPVLRFPDGRLFELTPGSMIDDPGHICFELERWLVAWNSASREEADNDVAVTGSNADGQST